MDNTTAEKMVNELLSWQCAMLRPYSDGDAYQNFREARQKIVEAITTPQAKPQGEVREWARGCSKCGKPKYSSEKFCVSAENGIICGGSFYAPPINTEDQDLSWHEFYNQNIRSKIVGFNDGIRGIVRATWIAAKKEAVRVPPEGPIVKDSLAVDAESQHQDCICATILGARERCPMHPVTPSKPAEPLHDGIEIKE